MPFKSFLHTFPCISANKEDAGDVVDTHRPRVRPHSPSDYLTAAERETEGSIRGILKVIRSTSQAEQIQEDLNRELLAVGPGHDPLRQTRLNGLHVLALAERALQNRTPNAYGSLEQRVQAALTSGGIPLPLLEQLLPATHRMREHFTLARQHPLDEDRIRNDAAGGALGEAILTLSRLRDEDANSAANLLRGRAHLPSIDELNGWFRHRGEEPRWQALRAPFAGAMAKLDAASTLDALRHAYNDLMRIWANVEAALSEGRRPAPTAPFEPTSRMYDECDYAWDESPTDNDIPPGFDEVVSRHEDAPPSYDEVVGARQRFTTPSAGCRPNAA